MRYFTIDYERDREAPDYTGPRVINSATEWKDPHWLCEDCDSIDFGVELTTETGQAFSIVWDVPGNESIGLWDQGLLGPHLSHDGDYAVWDVTQRSRWRRYVGPPVADVEMHYLPWGDEGFWCPRITLSFPVGRIEALLGECRKGVAVEPAADNVAVLFNPDELPPWEQSQ